MSGSVPSRSAWRVSRSRRPVRWAVVQYIKARRLGSIDETFPLGSLMVVTTKSLSASILVAIPISLIAWNLPFGIGLTEAIAWLVTLTAGGLVGYVLVSRLIGLVEPLVVTQTLLRSPVYLRRRPR